MLDARGFGGDFLKNKNLGSSMDLAALAAARLRGSADVVLAAIPIAADVVVAAQPDAPAKIVVDGWTRQVNINR